jgi:hypothetical protein
LPLALNAFAPSVQAKQAALMAKILARKQQPQSGSSNSDSTGSTSTATSANTSTVPAVQTEALTVSAVSSMPPFTALAAADRTSERMPMKKDKRATKAKHASASAFASADSRAPVKQQAVSKSTKSAFLQALTGMHKDKGAFALRQIYGMMIQSVHSGQRLHQVIANC